jgi:hypothetical protein
VRRGPGRVRQRLAAVLNASLPSINGVRVVWKAEQLYPATGRYRSDYRMDCCRWEGFCYMADRPEQVFSSVHCWHTMSECVKAGAVHFSGTHDCLAPGADESKGGS